MKKQINNLKLHYNNSSETLEKFFDILELKYNETENFFDITYPEIKIYLVSKPDLDTFVKKVSVQYKDKDVPAWVDGFSTSEDIHVLLPNENNIDEMAGVAIHEVVHLLTFSLDSKEKRPKILEEGIAVYLSKQVTQKTLNLIISEYLKGSLRKVSDFCIYDSIEFAQNKGYQYSFYITEFLINKYGKNVYISWLKEPNKFLSQLEKIEKEFEEYMIKLIKETIEKHEKRVKS